MKGSTPAFFIVLLTCASIYGAAPKNIIFCIGDGMGFEQVESAEIYLGEVMSFDNPILFPYVADCTTYSADSSITDSAAASTALATGIKVNNGVISMAYPGDGSELQTLLEFYQARGKSVGLITTAYLTHATPAGFGAHEPSRDNYTNIGLDYLTQTLPNILFGGGGNGLTLSNTAGAGYVVTDNSAGFMNFAPDGDPLTEEYFSGQFGTGYMPYKEDYLGETYPYPFLDDMVIKAIEILSEDPDGFFLMVEGGRIDHACHSNLIKECVHEVIDFSDAVSAARTWASGRSDTLILVTADHETGGLTVDGDVDAEGYPVASWTTTGHTGQNVPVYAWGKNANMVAGTLDNTYMFNVCTAGSSLIDKATHPYPSTGETQVAPNVTLAWTPGTNAVTHHVSVWLNTDPVTMVVDDVETTEPQYSLACDPGTTYAWRIDEYDGTGTLLAAGDVWNFTTLNYPTAATNLTPSQGEEVALSVALSWTAGDNVAEYRVYLDSNPVDPATTLVSTQTETVYSPPSLTNATTYYWKVVSINAVGQAESVIGSFVTEDVAPPTEAYATSENTTTGSITRGSLTQLVASDNHYEVLTEALNVPNKNGYSKLEHVWTFDVGQSVSAELYIEAYKTISADGDDFILSTSDDGVTYHDVLTITGVQDTDVAQVYMYPTPPSGTVYIKITDTDHTRKNQSLDSLYVDQLYIYTSTGTIIKHYQASRPNPADASMNVPLDQILSWTAGDEAVSHKVYFGVGGPDELSGPYDQTSPTFDPVVWAAAQGMEIQGDTVYFWRVDEEQADASVTVGNVWRYTTVVTGSCTPTNLFVDTIVLSTERTSPPNESGIATITIVDNCGNPVAGATVTGNFTGDFTDTDVTAITGSSGTAVFTSSTQVKKPNFGFEVTMVEKAGLVY